MLAETTHIFVQPTKTSHSNTHLPWKRVLLSSHDVYICRVTSHATTSLQRETGGTTTQKLRNDGRTKQTSLACLTSVEAAVSQGRLVMQMANAAPWDAAWHPGRRHRSLSWAACCCSLMELWSRCSLFSQVRRRILWVRCFVDRRDIKQESDERLERVQAQGHAAQTRRHTCC